MPAQVRLLGCTQDALVALCEARGLPAFRGRQIFAEIFRRRVTRFEEMTVLSKALRAELELACDLTRPAIRERQDARDGTRKYLFASPVDGATFEAVFIPEVAAGRKTNTLCVSSQTGCALGCAFCFTGSLRGARDLTTAEIVGQVLAARDDVGPDQHVTNIVFMGMGEPLLNYDAVVTAVRILTCPDGTDFSTRRVTISTAGIVPRIADLGRDLTTQLAISLNATTDEVRDRLMPINKKWPLADLLAALRAYPLPRRRRITIEYVLLDGINDSVEDARRLARLIEGIPVKVNLLPLNPHPNTELRPPPEPVAQRFQRELIARGMTVLRRTARGQEIAAACGLLGKSRDG